MIAVSWGEPIHEVSFPQPFAYNVIPPALEPLRARCMLIVQDVGERHEISPAVIMGTRRKAPIVRARHEAYWRALNETGATACQIAKAMGAFDASVVYRAARTHERRTRELQDFSAPPISPLSTDCSRTD